MNYKVVIEIDNVLRNTELELRAQQLLQTVAKKYMLTTCESEINENLYYWIGSNTGPGEKNSYNQNFMIDKKN